MSETAYVMQRGVQLFLQWAIMQGVAMLLQNRYQWQRLCTHIALGKPTLCVSALGCVLFRNLVASQDGLRNFNEFYCNCSPLQVWDDSYHLIPLLIAC
ncbi:hypothetical protein LOK49_Contig486G00002 [Camellia lanceoleosa]|nr:hypothetical protein LOK49_Contig486G00002 [Camellia lanceoleosa]